MAPVKIKENLMQPGPSIRTDGGLSASELLQTRPFFSMSVAMQPAGISVSLVKINSETSPPLCDWIRPGDGFSLVGEHKTFGSALIGLPNEKPAIALIDCDFSDRGVFDFLRQSRSSLYQTQFVVLSEQEDGDFVFNALGAGATGYLLRQTSCNELLATLKLIHAGGSPMSGAIARKVLQSFKYQSPSNSSAELSPRETRILRLLASGSSHNDTASVLNISLPMVSTYVRSIYEKLHLHTAAKIPL
jgi:DNA-binding NarL/FixJ family response regulator